MARPVTSSYPGHSGYARKEFDLYCEPGWAVDLMLDQVRFDGAIHDPCQGAGTIPSRCRARGLEATGSDIQNFGQDDVRDMFSITKRLANVASNPPFVIAESVLRHLIPIVDGKIVLLLRLSFLEAKCRDDLFERFPPSRILVHKSRVSCPPGVLDGPRDQYGAIVQPQGKGGKMPYAWFVWERGRNDNFTIVQRI